MNEHETKEDFKLGDYLYTSWGYDQTNTDFCQIVEISKTRKTVKCRMCNKEVEQRQRTADYVKPTTKNGVAFRLWVRKYREAVSFVGQYPFCGGDHEARRKGYFSKWNGKPMYETALGFGH